MGCFLTRNNSEEIETINKDANKRKIVMVGLDNAGKTTVL